MTDRIPSSPPPLTVAMPLTFPDRIHQIFPTLTATQIARIAAHGQARQIKKGEILLDVGDQLRFFVVTEGKLDILGGSDSSESLIVTLQPANSRANSIFSPAGARLRAFGQVNPAR